MKKALFTLTPAESKRLIAKAVIKMDYFQKAWEDAYVLIAGGTTNAFIAQELLGWDSIKIEKGTFGTSCKGVTCTTPADDHGRLSHIFYKGKLMDESFTFADAFNDFHLDTVMVKGANAVDPDWNVGIITTGFNGGTVPSFIGYITSSGLRLIAPVGLEKLVPSVRQSCLVSGARRIDYSLGAEFGMYHFATANVVSEIQALDILFGVKTTLVAAGGNGGSEGAVILIAEGEGAPLEKMIDFLEKEIKGEPPVPAHKNQCEICRYTRCHYCGTKEEELPAWLR